MLRQPRGFTKMEKQNILQIKNLSVVFDGFRALDDLTFSMNQGELRFVIGPNGAGKTTLLDVITGKTRPAAGTVLFDGGVDLRRTAEHQIVRKGIARKFQTPTVFGSLSVYENLEAAAGFKQSMLGLLGNLPTTEQTQVESILELINLTGRRNVRAGVLAHGERQWLEMGMMLVQQPKLLLLDEPVAGMTRAERNRTGELLQRIAEFCSVLVVEHDMEFLRSFATTVTVMHMGKLLTQGPVAQVQSDPKVIEVYLGRGHKH